MRPSSGGGDGHASGSEPANSWTGSPVSRLLVVGDRAGEDGARVNGLDLCAARTDHQPLSF